MIGYAETSGCLRATILRYFGDRPEREPCETCSNCARRTGVDGEQLLLVRKILSGIARSGERYGKRKVTAMLVGHLDELPPALTRLTTTGLLRNEEPRAVERWLDAACGAGLVRVSNDQYRTLSLTPLGREVMAGRVQQIALTVPTTRSARMSRTGRRKRRRHPLERKP